MCMFDISVFGPGVWLGAACMGLTLGLLGSGGSILTMPLLVYIANEPQKHAIAESLFIVGIVALVGSVTHLLKRSVAIKQALYFGLPSMLSAFAGAHASQWVSAQTQLMVFAIIMLSASAFMLKSAPTNVPSQPSHNTFPLVIAGLLVGLLAGFVGVGGGFLIVPALLLFSKLPMKTAVATSLVIIAMQSVSGFTKYILDFAEQGIALNWPLMIFVTGFAVIGVFVGMYTSSRLPQQQLKKLFGLMLIPLSVFIFSSNL